MAEEKIAQKSATVPDVVGTVVASQLEDVLDQEEALALPIRRVLGPETNCQVHRLQLKKRYFPIIWGALYPSFALAV
jgi:hypothetical protein